MNAAGFFSIILVLLATTMGGCANIIGCNEASWQAGWKEPGVFESFPAEGNRSGYWIYYETVGDQGETGNEIEVRKRASGDVNDFGIVLTSYEHHAVVTYYFDAAMNMEEKPESNEDLIAWVNETYQALGLGDPPANEIDFRVESCNNE